MGNKHGKLYNDEKWWVEEIIAYKRCSWTHICSKIFINLENITQHKNIRYIVERKDRQSNKSNANRV